MQKIFGRDLDNDGMTTVTYMLATGLSLIVLTWCTTFIIASYTRAAVRGASERATRAGVVEYAYSQDRTVAIESCNAAFEKDFHEAVSGALRNNIFHSCYFSGDYLFVEATGDLSGIGPMLVGARLNENTSRPIEDRP